MYFLSVYKKDITFATDFHAGGYMSQGKYYEFLLGTLL